ncbi:MAG: ATP-dependent helicase [Flavobacteriales bacterium]
MSTQATPLLQGLNTEQRAAVLSEHKRLLILAGAGAGKTKTLIEKILHLIFVEHVAPSSILAITFTRNAANEMVDRLIVHADTTGKYEAMLTDRRISDQDKDTARRAYKREHNWINGLTVGTFHGFAYKTLRSHVAKYWDNQFKIINEGITDDLRSDEAPETPDQILQKVILELCTDPHYMWALKRYILDFYVEEKLMRKQRKSQIYDGRIYTTLGGELVRSKSERMIADWLYRHSVRYVYEPVVDFADFEFKPDFYIPEADLYLEHISNRSHDPTDKDMQFRKAGKLCVKTYEQWTEDIRYFHGRLELYLKGRLTKPLKEGDAPLRFNDEFKQYGTELREFRRRLREVMDKVKVAGGSYAEVFTRGKADQHDRVSTFYLLAEPIFRNFDAHCTKRSYLDFNDLLIKLLEMLDQDQDVQGLFQQRFKYILVDEYQDVNNLQVQLVDKLLAPDAQLFCVGDDWQSIYGFRGSEVEHIVGFQKRYAEAKVIPFGINYRSTSTIVEASNAVIAHNKVKLDKAIKSLAPGGRRIQVYGATKEIEDGVEMVVKTVKDLYAEGFGKDDVLILYRRTKSWEPYRDRFKDEQIPVTARTVHSAKGLEARVVIIIGLTESFFPNVWENDRIFQMVRKDNVAHLLEEERRLFYVAVTRAKEMLYLVTEIGDESRFIKEMEERYIDRRTFATINYKSDPVSCACCGADLEAFFKFCPTCGTTRNELEAVAVRQDLPVGASLECTEHPAFGEEPHNNFTPQMLAKFQELVEALPPDTGSPSEYTLKLRELHPRSHMEWTSNEELLLESALGQTNDLEVLEGLFGRTISAMKTRAKRIYGR